MSSIVSRFDVTQLNVNIAQSCEIIRKTGNDSIYALCKKDLRIFEAKTFEKCRSTETLESYIK